MGDLTSHYSARDIEERILAAIRASGLDPEQQLAPEDLGALDHFHTGGRRATLDLLELAQIRAEDHVLDLGAGLAGPARLVASTRGCKVVCLEPSIDYCSGAILLNRLTGLDDQIEVRRGNALDLPFPESSFDIVWMQNVGMNIVDKRQLYAQIRRVLRPRGRFAFQEIAAGQARESYFPLPWAANPDDSHLVPIAELRAGLEQSGFVARQFEDTSQTELSRPPVGAAQGQLTLAVFVDNVAEKSRNVRRNLEEGRVRVVRGVFEAN